MFDFKKVTHEGVNYYNVAKSRTVNMTYDDVNSNNYLEVADFNCFTVTDIIEDVNALECEVMSYVACNKLNDEILNDIQKLDDITFDEALTLVSNVDRLKSIRENFILANYGSLDVDGNILNVYNIDGDGISVDFRKGKTLGNIVG